MDVFATPSGGILRYQYLNNCKYNAMNSIKSHFIAKYSQCKWQTTIQLISTNTDNQKHAIWTWQAWPSWQQCQLVFQPIELSLFQYIEYNEYLMNVHTDTSNIIPWRWYSQMENVETILSNVYDEFTAHIQ